MFSGHHHIILRYKIKVTFLAGSRLPKSTEFPCFTFYLFKHCFKYLFLIKFLRAEEPVVAGHLILAFHALFATPRTGVERLSSRSPVSRKGNGKCISSLKPYKHPVQFVKITAEAERIIYNCTDNTLWVDEEYSPDSFR